MAQLKLRTIDGSTGPLAPVGGSTGIYHPAPTGVLSISDLDYNFVTLNYQKLDKNLNLSDVQSAQTSRTNLGLGTLAVYNAGGATGLGNIGSTGITTLTSGSTGALVVSGGVGVGGNLTVAGTSNLNSITNVWDITGDPVNFAYLFNCFFNNDNCGIIALGSSYKYIFKGNNLSADRDVTFPTLSNNDTFVFQAHSQSLSNKSLTSTGNIGSTGITTLASGSTGALVVSGGVGVGGNLTVAGNTTLAAGTPSNAPLTIRSGTNLTAPATGAVEFDGTVFYATGSTGVGRVAIATPIFNSGAGPNQIAPTASTPYALFNTPNDTMYLPKGVYQFTASLLIAGINTSAAAGFISLDMKGVGTAAGTISWTGTGGVQSDTSWNNFSTGTTQNIFQPAGVSSTSTLGALQVTPTSGATGVRTYYINGSGIIKITTAGTIVPSYQSNLTLTGATGVILSRNNFITITPLTSTDTATSTGSWI